MKFGFLSKQEQAFMQNDFKDSFFLDSRFMLQDEQLKHILEKMEGNLFKEEFTREEFRRVCVMLEIYNVTADYNRGQKPKFSPERYNLIKKMTKKFNNFYNEPPIPETEQNKKIAIEYGEREA